MIAHQNSSRVLATVILCLFLGIACVSCTSSSDGDDIPSAAQGEKVLSDYLSSEQIKLVAFQKVNVLPVEKMGEKGYAIEFRADVEFLEDREEPADPGGLRGPAGRDTIIHRKGGQFTITGAVYCWKEKSGWREKAAINDRQALGERRKQ